MVKKTYQFGILAERAALFLLKLKGYKILFWRYKTKFGEINIIAQKGKVLAIVEVKARKRKTPIEAVLHPKQIFRIRKAVEIFLSRNVKYQKHGIRFDFIFVNRFFIPKHHKNFW